MSYFSLINSYFSFKLEEIPIKNRKQFFAHIFGWFFSVLLLTVDLMFGLNCATFSHSASQKERVMSVFKRQLAVPLLGKTQDSEVGLMLKTPRASCYQHWLALTMLCATLATFAISLC